MMLVSIEIHAKLKLQYRRTSKVIYPAHGIIQILFRYYYRFCDGKTTWMYFYKIRYNINILNCDKDIININPIRNKNNNINKNTNKNDMIDEKLFGNNSSSINMLPQLHDILLICYLSYMINGNTNDTYDIEFHVHYYIL
eukprot:447023_1